jgi:HEAT repeat protein
MSGGLFDRKPAASPLETVCNGKISSERQAALATLAKEAASKPQPEQAQIVAALTDLAPREANAHLRSLVYHTLGKYPGSEATLKSGLRDSSTTVRLACVRGLTEQGAGKDLGWGKQTEDKPEVAATLCQVLADDSSLDVRLEAARALGQFSTPETKAALRAALDDSDPALQRRAVESLAQCTGQNFGNDVPAWRTYLDGGTPTPKQTPIAEQMRGFLYRL